MVSPLYAAAEFITIVLAPAAPHILQLERYREDWHGTQIREAFKIYFC